MDWGSAVKVKYGPIKASIDGIITNSCAIEIESRVDKQIRGAIVDLLLHPMRKKLLILIPAHMNNPSASLAHCEAVVAGLAGPERQVRVVLLKGTGYQPREEEDVELIRDALAGLGCLPE